MLVVLIWEHELGYIINMPKIKIFNIFLLIFDIYTLHTTHENIHTHTHTHTYA